MRKYKGFIKFATRFNFLWKKNITPIQLPV